MEEGIDSELTFQEIIGQSPALKRVLERVKKVAATDDTVLVVGEAGSGKESIARAIHRISPRRRDSLVKVNCSATATGLLESELFGDEKSVSQADGGETIGRLESANQGTLFLHEIADFPLDLQPKLLRLLERREFARKGSMRRIPVNVRLIASSTYDLGKRVAERRFRQDLYDQLNISPIRVPPLRERREDIPLLVGYFVQRFARRSNKRIEAIPPETMNTLMKWDWPGNVRELENFIERAVVLTKGLTLQAPLPEM